MTVNKTGDLESMIDAARDAYVSSVLKTAFMPGFNSDIAADIARADAIRDSLKAQLLPQPQSPQGT
jgi:hypothetical protein